jgi:hypothetical protein
MKLNPHIICVFVYKLTYMCLIWWRPTFKRERARVFKASISFQKDKCRNLVVQSLNIEHFLPFIHNLNVKFRVHYHMTCFNIYNSYKRVPGFTSARRRVTLNKAFRKVPQSCQAKSEKIQIRNNPFFQIISNWLFTYSTLESRVSQKYDHELPK